MNKFKYNLVLLIILVLFSTRTEANRKVFLPDAGRKTAASQGEKEFGIDYEHFNVHKERVKPKQNLALILRKYNVPNPVIHEIVLRSKPVFDVRKIQAGKSYTAIRKKNERQDLRYLVYEKNREDFIVFDLGKTPTVFQGKRKVEIKTVTASGIIKSSLWKTIVDQNLDDEIVFRLSEIFAWTVDFYHLKKGDSFKIIFDEKYVGGERAGIAGIKAVKFSHGGVDCYAFSYARDSIETFYDENGSSLQRPFLKAPLKYSRVSSGFTRRRFHPVLKKYKKHLGIDYGAPAGTPVMSVGDGVVTEARYDRSNGKYVKIKHTGRYTSQYLHMSKIAGRVKPGARVRQGEIIGFVGKTGLATGPHLDFRFWENGKSIDFTRWKTPAVKSTKVDDLDSFNRYAEKLKAQLDGETGRLAHIDKRKKRAQGVEGIAGELEGSRKRGS